MKKRSEYGMKMVRIEREYQRIENSENRKKIRSRNLIEI